MARVGGVRIRRVVGIGLSLLAGACSSHPPEGTLVKPGPGVAGVPGGPEGIRASRAVPISGGTLLVASDGVTAVAADPDRDLVFLTNLATEKVRAVALEPGDEPGRSVQDAAGRVHVALRSGGAVVAIDLASGSIVSRTAVCGAPRGVAYDAARDVVHVACQGGELVSLNASTSEIVRVLRPGRDLRDVIVDGDRLILSQFRTAELLIVGPDGQPSQPIKPSYSSSFEGAVAWRTVAWPGRGVVMVHERADLQPLPPVTARYYGTGPCDGGLVQAAVGVIDPNTTGTYGAQTPLLLPYVAGPTDIAVSTDSQRLALVATGNSWDETHVLPRVVIIAPPDLDNPYGGCNLPSDPEEITGEPIAVAFDGAGRVVVQSREPAQLQVIQLDAIGAGTTIPLPGDKRADTGVALFHMNSGGGVACASCHPEGTDDGRVWIFDEVGPRRTQFVAGRMLDRAPYHWNGDLGTFRALVDEVFVRRMGAVRPNSLQAEIFGDWLNSIEPPVSTSSRPELVDTGRALFNDPGIGCTTCHTGSLLTDSKAYDVGTGGMFKVPSLIGVGSRAPYLHNGCATTLLERFGACGGGDLHGTTSQLSAGEVDALVAYLETL